MDKHTKMLEVLRTLRLRCPGCIHGRDINKLKEMEDGLRDRNGLTYKQSGYLDTLWRRHVGHEPDESTIIALHKNLCAKGAGGSGQDADARPA